MYAQVCAGMGGVRPGCCAVVKEEEGRGQIGRDCPLNPGFSVAL